MLLFPTSSSSSLALSAKLGAAPLFLYSLLLLSSLPTVLGAQSGKNRAMCRIKRKAGQGILAADVDATPPANPVPSVTQTMLGTNTTSSANTQPTATAAAYALPPFDYENQKVRGVNLGGWFMMEPWITPSMFDNTGNDGIVDEFTFGQYQDWNVASGALQQHWATWYTEQDFIQMAAAGLNHARLPIPYWSVPIGQDTGPYITGAWPYILQALDWAQAHGIYIILDLHGAPGSQNGFDNSGQRTANPEWATDPTFMNRTLDIIETIANQVANKVSVIELMNELAGFRDQTWADAARQFWQAGYSRVRAAAGDDVKIMIGDAFLGLGSWYGYLKQPAQGVMMDLHVYQIFSVPELQRSWQDHISFMCNRANEFTSYASSNLWLIMGEWSNAVTDCARYLNGRGVGARWDASYPGSTQYLGSCQGMTGNAASFSQDYKNFMRQYWEAQVYVAEKVNGWIYWTWKAENADDWSYLAGLQHGFIPQNPDERLYPNVCG